MKRPYFNPEIEFKKFLIEQAIAVSLIDGVLGENNSSDWNEDDEDGDEI